MEVESTNATGMMGVCALGSKRASLCPEYCPALLLFIGSLFSSNLDDFLG